MITYFALAYIIQQFNAIEIFVIDMYLGVRPPETIDSP